MGAAEIQALKPSLAFQVWTWLTTSVALLAFASVAVYLTAKYLRKNKDGIDTEMFLTARKTMPWVRIAWSFYAGSLGVWALATPANMAARGGYVALIAYSVSAGLPPLLISLSGDLIQRQLPRPLALPDFVLWRYGRAAQIYVGLVCAFTMALGLISEYSIIGSIFKTFVKSSEYPVIFLVGLSTLLYTTCGGLAISLITDMFQGIFSILLVIVLAIYLSVAFRPGPLPFPSEKLGVTSYGLEQLFNLPCSLISTTFFSESMWQRVWAAESRHALRSGAIASSLLVMLVMTAFGLTGILSAWAYNPSSDGAYANLFLFYSLGYDQYSWIGVLMVVLAATLNQSGVDSLQNALTASVSASLFRSKSITCTRCLVILINIPLMLLGTQTFPALDIFLVSNLLTTASVIPLVSGLFDPQRKFVSGYAMLFGCFIAILALSGFGIIQRGEFIRGLMWAWFENGYSIFAFIVPLLASLVGVCTWVVVAKILFEHFGVQRKSATIDATGLLGSTF